MNVIDKPAVTPVVLSDTLLDDVLQCRHSDAGAAWLWVIKCCGEETFLCEGHDAHALRTMADLMGSNAMCMCGSCKHLFGFHPKLNDVYSRTPI